MYKEHFELLKRLSHRRCFKLTTEILWAKKSVHCASGYWHVQWVPPGLLDFSMVQKPNGGKKSLLEHPSTFKQKRPLVQKSLFLNTKEKSLAVVTFNFVLFRFNAVRKYESKYDLKNIFWGVACTCTSSRCTLVIVIYIKQWYWLICHRNSLTINMKTGFAWVYPKKPLTIKVLLTKNRKHNNPMRCTDITERWRRC